MAIEKSVIIDELKKEGINETLGTGLNFETPEELSAWVTAFKTSLPKSKEIQDFTRKDFEELAKDPTFKGAKGLQSFIDSVRQKKEDKKPEESETEFTAKLEEALKPLKEEIAGLKEKDKKESLDSIVIKLTKESGITDQDLIDDIKDGLSPDYTEAQIKEKIEKKKKLLVKIGIKTFGTPSSGGNDGGGDFADAVKNWSKKNSPKKE